MTNEFGSVIVSWDFSKGKDSGVLLVGEKKTGGTVEIINAFQGDEAIALMKKLTIQNFGKGPVIP